MRDRLTANLIADVIVNGKEYHVSKSVKMIKHNTWVPTVGV